MTLQEIEKVATKIRAILDINRQATPDEVFKDFPRGACGVTSELLARYFQEFQNLNALYSCGVREWSGHHSHAWIEMSDVIVDITADQFGMPPVMVTNNRGWHTQWEQLQRNRPPIVSKEHWFSYPTSTWNHIVHAVPT